MGRKLWLYLSLSISDWESEASVAQLFLFGSTQKHNWASWDTNITATENAALWKQHYYAALCFKHNLHWKLSQIQQQQGRQQENKAHEVSK